MLSRPLGIRPFCEHILTFAEDISMQAQAAQPTKCMPPSEAAHTRPSPAYPTPSFDFTETQSLYTFRCSPAAFSTKTAFIEFHDRR